MLSNIDLIRSQVITETVRVRIDSKLATLESALFHVSNSLCVIKPFAELILLFFFFLNNFVFLFFSIIVAAHEHFVKLKELLLTNNIGLDDYSNLNTIISECDTVHENIIAIKKTAFNLHADYVKTGGIE